MRWRSLSRSPERAGLRRWRPTRTAPTGAPARPTTPRAPWWTAPRPRGRARTASIRPPFLPTTIPPVSSSGRGACCGRGRLSPTSMTSAPSSLTPAWNQREIREAMMRTGQIRASFACGGLGAAAFSAVLLILGTNPAAADFRLCNNTGSRVGIALGYKDTDGWTTEGWWNLSARTCETLVKGQLVARFYYVFAVDYDRGGEWSGKAYMYTRDKEITIRGIDDSLARD